MAAFDKEGEAMQNDSDKSKSASGSGSGGADESEGNGPPGEKGERKTTTEFKRETVDDVKANVAAGLTRGSHLLLYQEDQWGEAGAIELIERTGSKMGATTIALDIPDWSVIGMHLREDMKNRANLKGKKEEKRTSEKGIGLRKKMTVSEKCKHKRCRQVLNFHQNF
ncbi:hypothetical protein AX774_g6248 [Zancudomyces culisetae]|uniref:Uncharacterized protein n=1 Tax=Zancudomyces culisetae TaxID=1213189 RepID=A0A1R1PH68_ZANCU|nr:hypothetical protein AX774_g6248 [Zancudomyces culisetae]|eukprot:OMH80321.1 hypothetical protein AX774_g6248 [Zancudomyces culisetae]